MRAPWRGPWARGWLHSPGGLSRAHERSLGSARADNLALGRRRRELAGLDPRRLSLADLRHRRTAPARAVERTDARQTLHLCLGDAVRHTLSGICTHRAVGESAGPLGCFLELAAG